MTGQAVKFVPKSSLREGTDLLLILLVVAPVLSLAPRSIAAAAAAGGGAAAAAVVAARAGVVTGAAGDVAEHVAHQSTLLVDAVVVVRRDVHVA